ncbi:MAG TPA: hypothetical protein VF713_02115, partial [Thermoanaerobaculia bacterium]
GYARAYPVGSTMKPLAKYLLAGCLVLVLLVIAGVAAVAWYVRTHKDDLLARAREVRADGAKAGKELTEARCVDDALSRYSNDRGVIGGVRTRVWLTGCLDTSQPTEGFCSGVPQEREFMRTVTWRVDQCRARGLAGDSTCPNILAEVQQYCGGTSRSAKLAAVPGH